MTDFGDDEYTCNCTAGISGPNCEFDTNECASEPCLNGAQCLESNGTSTVAFDYFQCACASGFTGEVCADGCPTGLTGIGCADDVD